MKYSMKTWIAAMPYQSVSRTIDDSMGSFIKIHQYLAKSCLTNKKNEGNGMPERNHQWEWSTRIHTTEVRSIYNTIGGFWWGLGQGRTVTKSTPQLQRVLCERPQVRIDSFLCEGIYPIVCDRPLVVRGRESKQRLNIMRKQPSSWPSKSWPAPYTNSSWTNAGWLRRPWGFRLVDLPETYNTAIDVLSHCHWLIEKSGIIGLSATTLWMGKGTGMLLSQLPYSTWKPPRQNPRSRPRLSRFL